MGYVWCDGYVWDVRYVWDMCGVRYANNLLKNPATKRLSGKKKSKKPTVKKAAPILWNLSLPPRTELKFKTGLCDLAIQRRSG